MGSQIFTAPSKEGTERITMGPTRWQVLVCHGKQSCCNTESATSEEWTVPYLPPSAIPPPAFEQAKEIQLGNKQKDNLTPQPEAILTKTVQEFKYVIAWSEDDDY